MRWTEGRLPTGRALVLALLAACPGLMGPASAQAPPPGEVQAFELDLSERRQVTVSWEPPADTGGVPVASYRIYARTPHAPGDPDGGAPDLVAEVPGDARNATVTRFPTGTSVLWSMSAVTTAGEGRRSHEITINVPPVYGPPLGLRAQLGERRVLLEWDPPANKTTHSADPVYLVYRKAVDDEAFVLLDGTYALGFEDAAPPDGEVLAYAVVADTWAGASPPSDTARIATPTLPGAPIHVRATPGVAHVVLSWEAPPPLPDGERAERYRIYRAEPGDEHAILLREVVGVLAHTDRDLPAEATYDYAVRAVTPWGEGPPSAFVRATTLAPAAAAPPGPFPDAPPPFWATSLLNWTAGTLVAAGVTAMVARRRALKVLVEERAPLLQPPGPDLAPLRGYLALVRSHSLASPAPVREARRRLDAAIEAASAKAPEDGNAALPAVADAARVLRERLEFHARRWRIPIPAPPPSPASDAPSTDAETLGPGPPP